MEPNDPGPAFSGDDPQCAFSCHDLGGNTTPANIAEGLANAHTAGATTRFDVMTAAAQQLITHVQTESTSSSTLAKNTYIFNVMSFDTALHTWGTSNMGFSSRLDGGQLGYAGDGLTYIDTAMSSLVTTLGTNGNGGSVSSPKKFLMLVTDGLKSDRSNNWSCTWENTSAWGQLKNASGSKVQTCTPSTGYDAPMNTANCTSLKNNGIVIAVLETPYVSLAGQDQQVMPYERTVQATIYPGGPGTPSVVSAALQACATSGYYFQATSSSDIANGFITLTDKWLQQMSYIAK